MSVSNSVACPITFLPFTYKLIVNRITVPNQERAQFLYPIGTRERSLIWIERKISSDAH